MASPKLGLLRAFGATIAFASVCSSAQPQFGSGNGSPAEVNAAVTEAPRSFALKKLRLGLTQPQFIDLFPDNERPESLGPPICATDSRKKMGYDAVCQFALWKRLFGGARWIPPGYGGMTYAGLPVSYWDADFVDGKAVAVSVVLSGIRPPTDSDFAMLVAGLSEHLGPGTRAFKNARGGQYVEYHWLDLEGNVVTATATDVWDSDNRSGSFRVRVEAREFLEMESRKLKEIKDAETAAKDRLLKERGKNSAKDM